MFFANMTLDMNELINKPIIEAIKGSPKSFSTKQVQDLTQN